MSLFNLSAFWFRCVDFQKPPLRVHVNWMHLDINISVFSASWPLAVLSLSVSVTYCCHCRVLFSGSAFIEIQTNIILHIHTLENVKQTTRVAQMLCWRAPQHCAIYWLSPLSFLSEGSRRGKNEIKNPGCKHPSFVIQIPALLPFLLNNLTFLSLFELVRSWPFCRPELFKAVYVNLNCLNTW